MTSRCSAWSDGTRSNAQALPEAIHESFRELVCQQQFYVSEGMKQGIDVDGLTVHADLLASIIKLDPRGGIVRQLDMKEAVQQLSEMPDVRAAFEAMALAHRKQPKDLVLAFAYSIRVMLAHVRLKHSQFQRLKGCETLDRARNHPEELREIYALFDVTWKQASPSKTQPFSFFQDAPEELFEDSEDFELFVPVTKVLTWGDNIVYGTMRMSDGRIVIANGYNEGPVFIEATFPGGETLDTCIPNQYLEPEGRFILRPPSALPYKELVKQREPKPKAETKIKSTPGVKAKLKPKRAVKAKLALIEERIEMTERLERIEKNKSPYLKVMRTVPEDAQISDLGSAKSFTKRVAGKTASIGVVLNRHYFYVCLADAVPPLPLRVNNQRGVQISWSGDSSKAWATAKAIAQWD